jgi:hypothetical protein
MLPLLLLVSTFETYLAAEYPPADGFDVPGSGIVHAAANGRVKAIEAGAIVVEHLYYENHEKRTIEARYERLSAIEVKKGDIVFRRQKIGEGNVRYRIERAVPKKSFVPQDEPSLVLVDQETRRLALYSMGKLIAESEVGFGQRPGRKRRQGDLKTPKGMYFVTNKRRGEFSGPYGDYYGGHWIKINYPNAYDAAWGVEQKLIDRSTAESIRRNWLSKKITDQRTPLGGGIGFHGWAHEWSWDDTGWLSWGCIVLHNEDIQRLFDQIPVGAMIVLM